MVRRGGKLVEASWAEALSTVAAKFTEVKTRSGKFGIIGSNHTTNEENYYLQKFARQVLNTHNIDHHRTGDVATLLNVLNGRPDALATMGDLYNTKAALIIGNDLAQQQPLIAFQLRANWRHHKASVYAVVPGPVREDQYAKKIVQVEEGRELEALPGLAEDLKALPELTILYGDTVKGDGVRRLVEFGDSLGIPVKYVPLVDYSNSRGAADMGLLPDLLPGYRSVRDAGGEPGLAYDEILASPDLDVLWVVGANPLADHTLAAQNAFVVVQDMFLTETAQVADVFLPAASAYEKNGTVTNVCGEVQRLRAAARIMGPKADLEIIGLLSREMKTNIGIWKSDNVLNEIRTTVPSYNVSLLVIDSGGAAQTVPGAGTAAAGRPDLVKSARNNLFHSGTLGRYCQTLNAVAEAPGTLYGEPVGDRAIPEPVTLDQ
jgi:NADH-quinone oxidoreductase subunit G